MIYIRSREGLLFRGAGLNDPSEIWDHPRKRGVNFNPRHQTVFAGWASKVSAEAAELLKTNKPAAEHYDYDIPPWLQPYG